MAHSVDRFFSAIFCSLLLPRFPFEFRAEVNHEETRVMGLS